MTIANNLSRQEKYLDNDSIIFFDDVIKGLSKNLKTLPCKYFYDEYGSQLFEQICDCRDYYLTVTEMSLLQEIAPEIAEIVGEDIALLEPGAGAIRKLSLLLNEIKKIAVYIPTDISGAFLQDSAERIRAQFPEIVTHPLIGDFTQKLDLGNLIAEHDAKRTIIFFPGSTFGNFTPEEGKIFLQNMAQIAGDDGGLIIGIDLVKDAGILERAYDDCDGITAKFNKNILTRINNELNGNFDLECFSHKAVFNQEDSRMEMHLVSNDVQNIKIGDTHFEFKADEIIHTENSYKYTKEKFAELAELADFPVRKYWTDENNLFSIQYLSKKPF